MSDLTLTCFGVGDGWPSADRNHSSFLYRASDTSILIDCGESVSRTFKAGGQSYDLVDRIFLSHLHFDHVGGLFMLMQSFWLEARTKPLTVHLPAEGIDPIRRMLHAGCIFDELLQFPLEFAPLRAAEPVQVGRMRVTPFPTTHLARLEKRFQARYPQRFEAFSFLLEVDGLRVAHSADLGGAGDLLPLLASPVDLLVCEIAHIEPEVLFEFLRGREIREVVFVHLSRACRERLPELKTLASQTLGPIQFTFAEDGTVWPGSPGRP